MLLPKMLNDRSTWRKGAYVCAILLSGDQQSGTDTENVSGDQRSGNNAINPTDNTLLASGRNTHNRKDRPAWVRKSGLS
ncbi:hypothetical protein [Mesorhizobium sp.]|uniref:hypothetical protein n=1 Tax=Mesorhizobium sp. TaxID=1871066 RepID=UPI0025C034D5|nr:hypothetical protein [Mesorhizobium sp.]